MRLLRRDIGGRPAPRGTAHPFPRQEIEAGQDHHGSAGEGPEARNVAKYEKAKAGHEDEAEIGERRQNRRGRMAMGEDQEPMAEPAPQPKRGEQQPDISVLRPLPCLLYTSPSPRD